VTKKAKIEGPTLLEHAAGARGDGRAPLAERMRPERLDEVVGQSHLLKEHGLLRTAIESDRLPSLILWGPPGVGKTTLAQVIAHRTRRTFASLSAVLGGLADLRAIVSQAEEDRKFRGRSTLVFVDEIHRFNKAQQDAFLPHLEKGTLTLIGATTENPSFSVNAAILSRAKVLTLRPLETADILQLLERALTSPKAGLLPHRPFSPEALRRIAEAAEGDARRALNLLEATVELGAAATESAAAGEESRAELSLAPITEETLEEWFSSDPNLGTRLNYDRSGDQHYGAASALIKSLRGSDPDAALYYFLRMLDGGEDPNFLSRRMIIFASEDVGNADPRALTVALDADAAFRRLGLPEGVFPLAHACLYLASCPKSGAVKAAISRAREAIATTGSLPIPLKLQNAPTKLHSELGHGRGYQYPHDFAEGFVPGETYLPERLIGQRFYEPTAHGLEKAIGERLERIFRTRAPKS
jgi:putative ATPase